MRSPLSQTALDAESFPIHTRRDPPAVGNPAPDFVIPWASGRSLTLADFRGSPVVLVFHPPHWDPAATEHIESYNRLMSRLPGPQAARLLSINEQGVGPWRELGFADAAVTLPVLSVDAAALARDYGVSDGPAVFVIDGSGTLRWRHCAVDSYARPEDVARSLAALAQPPDAERSRREWTRREFVATALAASFALALMPLTRSDDIMAQPSVPVPPGSDAVPGMLNVTLNVNGRSLPLTLEPRVTLLDALREYAGLTGTKKGCDHGQCGACTVHSDGRRVLSCLNFAVMQQGKKITTIEGLAHSVGVSGNGLHPMQQAFLNHDGFQCGYCTPGQIMSASAVVSEPWGPDDADVREAMSGNICRCGAYPNIVDAVQEVRRSKSASTPATHAESQSQSDGIQRDITR